MKSSTKYLFIFAIYLAVISPVCGQKNYELEREKMIQEQIIARGISDKNTLNALRKVKRHLFVPKDIVQHAYNDHPLPIGNGQTISQPYIVAYMTEKLNVEPGDTVLEIGTGSGYQAAVLAEIVDQVYTIEIVEALARKVSVLLKELNYSNIEVQCADGYHGWPSNAPYDAIIVTAASEEIPEPLLKQLKEGGRMIIPVGKTSESQSLMVVTKVNGKIKTRNLLPVRFVPFTRKE